MNNERILVVGVFAAVLMSGLIQSVGSSPLPASGDVGRGRTLVAFGACNDCHTPGWRESDATIPVSRWMTGNEIGFRGPWGTVYPANVRLEFQMISEDQWLAMVRTRGGHPPMTWHNLRALDTEQLRSIYRFVRSLGPAGVEAPLMVSPAKEPTTPYYDVAPKPSVPSPAHS